MTAVFTLVSLGIRSVSLASNELTASFLASEGIEYIRNVRDGNVLSRTLPVLSANRLSECESFRCYVDVRNTIIENCNDGCPPLRFNREIGIYNHDTEDPGTNDDSIFTRQISLSKFPDGEATKVRSIVSWRQFPGAPERFFVIETTLFDTTF